MFAEMATYSQQQAPVAFGNAASANAGVGVPQLPQDFIESISDAMLPQVQVAQGVQQPQVAMSHEVAHQVAQQGVPQMASTSMQQQTYDRNTYPDTYMYNLPSGNELNVPSVNLDALTTSIKLENEWSEGKVAFSIRRAGQINISDTNSRKVCGFLRSVVALEPLTNYLTSIGLLQPILLPVLAFNFFSAELVVFSSLYSHLNYSLPSFGVFI